MANGSYEINEKTYKNMEADDRDWILYETFNAYRIDTEKRLCKLEKRRLVHAGASFLGGILGGFAAIITKALAE